ncbi:MAG: hypothetical protein R3F02_02820 [Thiolinea sp.]
MEPVILNLAYILPLAALVWLWTGFRLPLASKLWLTLLLPLVYGLHWYGLRMHQGWPADVALPEEFQLLAAEVVEPRKGIAEGAVYLWIRHEEEKPRVHALPYSRKLHETLHTARERMEQGRTQVGVLMDEDNAGSKGARLGNGRALEFRDQAKGNLPPKRIE